MADDPMTLAQAARVLRAAAATKSYREAPLGEDVAAYLRTKRKRLTPSSERSYAASLDKLAEAFPDLQVEDFEPPAGSELLEKFLDDRWGAAAPGTYNANLAIVADFFKHWQKRGRLQGNPTLLIDRARKQEVERSTFTGDQRRAIIGSAGDLRDRIALHLLLDYGLRKSALRAIQFKHFDHERKRVTIFTKGEKVREVPLPDRYLWLELERHILETEAEPSHYLMCLVKPIPVGRPDRHGRRRTELRRFPARQMSSTATHRWWYRRLEEARIVPAGVTSGERLHKARHTAGQRVLDASGGNLKAVQKLLGHASIQTTGDVYSDWDLDQLTETLATVLDREEDDE